MSSISVALGQAIPLTLQVYDGNASVFPRATVYDANFNEVYGSPFVMTSVADGLYKNTSFIPTTAGRYIAKYTVYSGNDYATLLTRYMRSEDQFDVNTLLADTTGLNAKNGTPHTGTIASDIANVDDDVESSEGRTT
jgi:hypothetical protein